jgi:hypothetical protein
MRVVLPGTAKTPDAEAASLAPARTSRPPAASPGSPRCVEALGALVAAQPGGGTQFSGYHGVVGGSFAPYGTALHRGDAYATTGSITPAAATPAAA